MQSIRTTQTVPVNTESDVPANYFGQLPVRFGVIFGLMGSLLVMVVIAILTLAVGEDLWRSPRIIASAVMGEQASIGVLPIFVGTLIHFASGALYGAIFARVMPRLPRPYWIVGGLLFGVAIWVIAVFALPLFVQTGDLRESLYFGALLIAHVVYGLNLGLAGALYGIGRSSKMSY